MSNSSSLAPVWAAGRSALSERKVELQLKRFNRRYRLNVLKVAQKHPALADLAVSFPALLFMLSVPHKGVDAAALQRLVMVGVPLKALAKLATLPLWMRKLPPEAFGQPLVHLPRHETYARQIGNFVPRKSRHVERWLNNVMLACEFGDEAFAVWVAREFQAERLYPPSMRHHALWAWFSARPGLVGHGLVKRPWTPQIGKLAARNAMADWLSRLRLHVTIADAVHEPLWLEPKTVDGFDFVPLLSANSIHEEAQAMENCVRSYGSDIATNAQRLWSMRRDGKRHATLSVGNNQDLGLLTITEIKGPKNERVPRDVAVAAKRWIDSVDVTKIEISPKNWDDFLPNPKAWACLFKPYWLEKQHIPHWLPLAPKAFTLGRL